MVASETKSHTHHWECGQLSPSAIPVNCLIQQSQCLKQKYACMVDTRLLLPSHQRQYNYIPCSKVVWIQHSGQLLHVHHSAVPPAECLGQQCPSRAWSCIVAVTWVDGCCMPLGNHSQPGSRATSALKLETENMSALLHSLQSQVVVQRWPCHLAGCCCQMARLQACGCRSSLEVRWQVKSPLRISSA